MQKQYIYISEHKRNNKDKAVLLTVNAPYTPKRLAIIYMLKNNKYYLYRCFRNEVPSTVLLYNEYDVLTKYHEVFEYNINKYLEFMDIVKAIKEGKEPKCQIEYLNY